MGRHSHLTPERAAAVTKMVRSGALIKTACQACGIHESTYFRWINRADDPDAPEVYREFRESITRARALAEMDALTLVRQAGRTDWRAAAWFLERSFPQDYGRHQKLEHTGEDGGPITLAGLAALMGVGEDPDDPHDLA